MWMDENNDWPVEKSTMVNFPAMSSYPALSLRLSRLQISTVLFLRLTFSPTSPFLYLCTLGIGVIRYFGT